MRFGAKFKLVNSNSTQTMRAADTLLNFQEKKIGFEQKKSLVVILFFSGKMGFRLIKSVGREQLVVVEGVVELE